MRPMMGLLSIVIWIVLSPAMAQDTYVPLSEEPKHVLKLVNGVIRAVLLTIPPGESTLFHEHIVNEVNVTLEGAEIEVQAWQAEPTVGRIESDRVAYWSYTGRSTIHRLKNVGDTTFRMILVEIFSTPVVGSGSVPPRDRPYVLALENERVRVWRLEIAPGQSDSLVSLELPTLRITRTGGSLTETVDGRTSEQAKVSKPGDLEWFPVGTSVSVLNPGDEPIVIYDIEIK